MNSQNFKAPWGKTLRWMSLFSFVIFASACVPALLINKPEELRWLVVLPVLILPGAALFIIRSYEIEPHALAIRRLFWTTRLSLSDLQSAVVAPDAMRRSLRLCGNGGMFSITGWYRNSALGNYRAFVTNLEKTVVLRFAANTIVVSPENPEQFVSEISQFAFRTSLIP
jgi:hypothetical protein